MPRVGASSFSFPEFRGATRRLVLVNLAAFFAILVAGLAARDATAHAPSPNWLEVDRDNLKGRMIAQPKREELVQIQLNEQLIVELYSK